MDAVISLSSVIESSIGSSEPEPKQPESSIIKVRKTALSALLSMVIHTGVGT
jgi:hypothetical protein